MFGKKKGLVDFKCSQCNGTITLDKNIPLVNSEVHCLNGESHTGMVIIPTKTVGYKKEKG